MDGGTGGSGELCSTRESTSWAPMLAGGSDVGGADGGKGADGEGGLVEEGLKDSATQMPSTDEMVALMTSPSKTAARDSTLGIEEMLLGSGSDVEGTDGEGGLVMEGLKDSATQMPSTGLMIAPSTSLSETAAVNSALGFAETLPTLHSKPSIFLP